MVRARPRTVSEDVLAEVAAGAASDSGQVPVALLGDFLPAVVAAVGSGDPLSGRQMKAYQSLGAQAARQGVALRALLDLYLSASWRLWRHLPAVAAAHEDPDAVVVAGEVMLHATDDAVAALAEGYQLARRALVRAQESTRREFVDDLLTGTADVTGLLARASGFGLDLTGPHAVALVTAEVDVRDDLPVIGSVQRAVQGRRGDAEAMVATKEGRLVVVFAAPDRAAVEHVLERIVATLGPRPGESDERVRLARRMPLGAWQITLGRTGIGPEGVAASYREARAGRDIAERLELDTPVVEARDLLVHQLLLRDRPAIVDLVATLLTPLLDARGGAEPLLDTLAAYFGSGGNAAPCHAQMYTMASLLKHGDKEQKQRYLPQIAKGEIRLQAFGVTEPDAGSNTLRITTTARKVSGGYRISGQKIWTSRYFYSDLYLLLARTSAFGTTKRKTEGLSLFLIDIKAAGDALKATPIRTMLNHHTCQVFLDDVFVPDENLVGQEGKGFLHLLDSLNAERLLVASESIGDGKWFIETSSRYANERVVFDRKIGANQGVQFPIAKAHINVEAAELMRNRAATHLDAGIGEAREASMAKYLASEASWEAAEATMTTFGGYGFACEFDVERKWREARLFRTAPIANNLVLAQIAEHVLGLPRSY